VSQLSLVAHNAERHADNPEFRADMVVTLQSSVKKMNDLLARLTRDKRTEPAAPREAALHPILAPIVAAKEAVHPVLLFGDPAILVKADAAQLEQAVAHLLQNAIEASAPGEAVRVCFGRRGSEIAIEVIDSGAGMSAEFIGSRLFQPFASTKDGGFGIGAFEARTLVTAMGGRIEVESREGEGSRFTIFMPVAEADAALPIEQTYERKRA
jgi:signal transduction histidine kinase